jgi:acyl-coenzyme A synthetase/AMP-(fatty) acid ligase
MNGLIFHRHNRDSLKVLGTVGEPINPEAWLWYRDVVGNKRCPVVDTYWQTETVRCGRAVATNSRAELAQTHFIGDPWN